MRLRYSVYYRFAASSLQVRSSQPQSDQYMMKKKKKKKKKKAALTQVRHDTAAVMTSVSAYARALAVISEAHGALSTERIHEAIKCVKSAELTQTCNLHVGSHLDDVVVVSADLDTHVSTLRRILEAFNRYNLRISPSKSAFGASSARVLGSVIDDKGTYADPVKARTLQDWPTPTSVKELRGFLGLGNYLAPQIPSCLLPRTVL